MDRDKPGGSLERALLPQKQAGEQTSSTGNYSTYYTTNVKRMLDHDEGIADTQG